MIEESEIFWKQICHGGLFLSLWWPCSKRNKQQNIILANLSTTSHCLMIHSDSPDPLPHESGRIWNMYEKDSNYIKWIYFYWVKVFLSNYSIPSSCLLEPLPQTYFWTILSSATNERLISSYPFKRLIFCCVVGQTIKRWDLFSSSALCSLLLCRLLDSTLANSLSMIYDQKASQPEIYYPLLLSVRQHYIILHCLSQFASIRMHHQKTFAVYTDISLRDIAESEFLSFHPSCNLFIQCQLCLKMQRISVNGEKSLWP